MEGANARAAIRDMTARLTLLGASEVVGLELAHTSEDGKLDLGRTLQGRSITSDDRRCWPIRVSAVSHFTDTAELFD